MWTQKQECIPVGCVPSAAVAVCWGGGWPGGVSAQVVSASMHWGRPLPHCEQNDWQTGVKTLPFHNFVCVRLWQGWESRSSSLCCKRLLYTTRKATSILDVYLKENIRFRFSQCKRVPIGFHSPQLCVCICVQSVQSRISGPSLSLRPAVTQHLHPLTKSCSCKNQNSFFHLYTNFTKSDLNFLCSIHYHAIEG